MARTSLKLILLIVLSALAVAQSGSQTTKITLLKVGRLLDVRAGKYLANQGVLVENEKIKEVGPLASVQAHAPKDAAVVDLSNATVLPGLIDCHSHTAILGSVNESTLPSTAMVRIHDVVNSETPNLYEQLAGGVTAVNLLHGSANGRRNRRWSAGRCRGWWGPSST